MWFVIGSVMVLVLIMVAALASDLRRRAKLRRLGESTPGRGVDAAARHSRAGLDVQGGRATGAHLRGSNDLGSF